MSISVPYFLYPYYPLLERTMKGQEYFLYF